MTAKQTVTRTSPLRVCVVGPGARFLSGITYYIQRLANVLAQRSTVSAILMRQLLPTFLYPGRARVGAAITNMRYAPGVPVFDGVDWYWIPSIFRALWFLARQRPDVLILHWWTGTVLHSYLALAIAARLLGSKVVVEFHEVLDTGEAKIPAARLYVGIFAPILMRQAHGFVIHSDFDRAALQQRYRIGDRPVAQIPLGPFDQYLATEAAPIPRPCPPMCCHLLYFGVIRPFKGVEDLVNAFDAISEDQIDQYWLTIVGETWEGWTLPTTLIEGSRYRDRITFVNRYVRDEEVAGFFSIADVVVLPYHRSSASGPLHVAMSHGLPVVVTEVGGLVEAAAGYRGATFVPPHDPPALRAGIERAAAMRGQHFDDPHGWDSIARRYEALFGQVVEGNASEELTPA
jgi:glycosyltransferase involved in cell wall biosynthesis